LPEDIDGDLWPEGDSTGNPILLLSLLGAGHGRAPSITPLFSFESRVTLEEEMAVALETFYRSKLGEYRRQGARIENVIVVMKTGYEMLTQWPDDRITEYCISNRRLI